MSPVIIPICIMNQKAAELVGRRGEVNRTAVVRGGSRTAGQRGSIAVRGALVHGPPRAGEPGCKLGHEIERRSRLRRGATAGAAEICGTTHKTVRRVIAALGSSASALFSVQRRPGPLTMVTCAQAIDSMIVPFGGQGALRPFPAADRVPRRPGPGSCLCWLRAFRLPGRSADRAEAVSCRRYRTVRSPADVADPELAADSPDGG